jgi:phospholipid/cholesterol/gamma-HCH transport system substrate-binding protein
MTNLQKSSKGLNENMKAAKSNFLLRGYFRKKERAAEKKKEEAAEAKKEAADAKKE